MIIDMKLKVDLYCVNIVIIVFYLQKIIYDTILTWIACVHDIFFKVFKVVRNSIIYGFKNKCNSTVCKSTGNKNGSWQKIQQQQNLISKYGDTP